MLKFERYFLALSHFEVFSELYSSCKIKVEHHALLEGYGGIRARNPRSRDIYLLHIMEMTLFRMLCFVLTADTSIYVLTLSLT